MKEYTITIDVPVIEGQIFVPAHVNWGNLSHVKGYKILGIATHADMVSASLLLVTDDAFVPAEADWTSVVQRPGVQMQPTWSVKDVVPGTQYVAPQGEDATQFGKVGG